LKTLYILRHGETVWNTQARMQGRLDSALTDKGREQAAEHARVLASVGIDTLVISPSGRTRETANIVNSHVNAPVNFDDRLMERDCGTWSGLTVDEIQKVSPDVWAARNADGYHFRPPEGENLPDMLIRVKPLLTQLEQHNGATIGLVTHGVMSRVILSHYLGLTPEEAMRVRHPNDLFYALSLGGDKVDVVHYHNGRGPISGANLHPID
jgi:probable phosphoglycerate mutase